MAIAVLVHVAMASMSWSSRIHSGGDNAAYVSLANALAQGGSYVETWSPGTPDHAKYPPMYPAVLAAMILLGAKSWTAFKALSMVFTALATAFCFLWVRRMHGAHVALVAAVLLGASPAVQEYAKWILADPLFLALTLASLWLLTPAGNTPPAETRARPGRRRAHRAEPGLPLRRLAVGLLLVVAAYFTRSAGLPLVVAVLMWLALKRRWVPLVAFGVVFAAVALPWQLRGGDEYISEFWLLNPYDPDMGRAGLIDLVSRASENLWVYTVRIVPDALAGVTGIGGGALGIALGGLAAVGWLRRMGRGIGAADLFFVLYAGLILLWPPVWSGDRFALPLLPLILLYAGESAAAVVGRLRQGNPRSPPVRTRAGSAWLLSVPMVLLIPQGLAWGQSRTVGRACAPAVEQMGPLGCYGRGVRDFHAVAHWAGQQLPAGAVVFTRKPRMFHVFSGLASVTYPFSRDTDLLVAQADSLGVGYVVRDQWGSSAATSVDPVLRAHPGRFCVLAQLSAGSDAPVTSVIQILRPSDDVVPGDAVLARCPQGLWRDALPMAAITSMTVPILDRDRGK